MSKTNTNSRDWVKSGLLKSHLRWWGCSYAAYAGRKPRLSWCDSRRGSSLAQSRSWRCSRERTAC